MLNSNKKDYSELSIYISRKVPVILPPRSILNLNLSLIVILLFILVNVEFNPGLENEKQLLNRLKVDSKSWGIFQKASNFKATSNFPFKVLSTNSGNLEVRGRNLYYQRRKIFLVGVSRREALHRDWYKFGLKKYEDEIIKYKLNYERIDAVRNYKKLRRHCLKMKKHGIIVELTLYDSGQGGFLADIDQVIKATGDLGNIIYEPVNELYSDKDVRVAKKLTNYLVKKGFIVSAGAFGAGGEKWSEKFDPIKSANQIISVHRPWYKESILKYKKARKPIIRNEYFDRGELGLNGVISVMSESFEAGAAGVNYYGFRMERLKDLARLDPEPYWKYLKFVSLFCQKLQKRKT
ncbi:MAG: hypothetical protein ACE5GI_00940 [Candidatus Aminicenantales bacterium]